MHQNFHNLLQIDSATILAPILDKMTAVPYPSYKLLTIDIVNFGHKDKLPHLVKDQIEWCKDNFDADDWDIDPLNMTLLFRTHELFVWFVLQWDPQYLTE